jgi:hypothetical protein
LRAGAQGFALCVRGFLFFTSVALAMMGRINKIRMMSAFSEKTTRKKAYSAPFYKENKTADLLGADYKSPLFQTTSQPFQPRVSTFSVRKIKENY